jgi:hypothetical protein
MPTDLTYSEIARRAVITLPGVLGSKRNWTFDRQQLAEHHRVLTLD